MKLKGNQLPWDQQLSSMSKARETTMEGVGRRRARSLQEERRMEDKGGSRTKNQGPGLLSNTSNAMKEAMAHRHARKKDR
ncbi:hypothetical protein Pmani_017361 [Petrolisthes manimaculis]|uniref:Uncharacterized protein n=1 Tax=Petrolisthes manimaculis TaxID=1843537 RepID=A0AAE1PPP0_9EUCA|nr:hypothetical protein Pmani_017361 [Petrolisthes manimaculis]